MNGKEVINMILANESIKAATFARKIGVTPPQIYDLQKGKIKGISSKIADKIIAIYPKYNKTWLITGMGEMLAQQTEEKELVKINMLNIPIPLETPKNAPQGNFSERRRMVERIKLIEPNFKTERPNSISIALSELVEKSPTQALWVMTGKDDKVVLDRTQYEMMLEKMSLLEKLNKIYREESASDANIIPPSVKHL
jgi:plasmid maintenance system antidote protein VapI